VLTSRAAAIQIWGTIYVAAARLAIRLPRRPWVYTHG